LTTEKIVMLAPIPSASVIKRTAVSRGDLASMRSA